MIEKSVFPRVKGVEVRSFRTGDISRFYADRPAGGHSALLKTGRRMPGHRYSVAAFSPFLILRARGNKISVYGKYGLEVRGDPFKALTEVLEFYKNVKIPEDLPLRPGAVGAFSYDLKDSIEDIPVMCEDAMGCPDIHITFFRLFFIRDEAAGRDYSIDIDAEDVSCVFPQSFSFEKPRVGKLKSDFTEREYKSAVRSVKRRITEGDIYQANISQQFSMDYEGDAFSVFDAVDGLNPAPMSAFFDCGDFRIISSSPERFLMRKGGSAESRPIKGTRPRGRTPSGDARMMEELIKSPKDRAELAMIVDLVRNDLGRTSLPSSVRVKKKRLIEKYSNVFHSLAVVSSSVGKDLNPLELIKTCFPGGSVTGCPKVQAMKVIEETEKHRRGFYCGSIGYIGFDGDFDLNIAIRTFIQKEGKLFFNLGGGIVYDSDPQSEYEETMHKGRSMFEAVKKAATYGGRTS